LNRVDSPHSQVAKSVLDDDQPPALHPTLRGWRRWCPLPETSLLLAAFLVTIGAKIVATHRIHASELLISWVAVCARDAVFFASCFALFQVMALLLPRRFATRLVVAAAGLLLIWSLLDAAWLLYSGVQLQPGILRVIGYSPEEFWPHVSRHLSRRKKYTVPGMLLAGIFVAWVAWRIIRPAPRAIAPRSRVTRLLCALLVIAPLAMTQPHLLRVSGLRFSGEVLEHNSHWYALVALIRPPAPHEDVTRGRVVPRAGERAIGLPKDESETPPNVVLLLLESIAHSATSLAPQGTGTPNLQKLAEQGAEFVSTHVPVSQTGKAYWATLTGTRPDLHYDFTEAVLVDETYESLATILKRAGYRSAFFEMSKGTFQCAPGVFANMGFDWGWWRENLEDSSTALGYLAGDDFRMLDPAFAWVTSRSDPFLLMMITSVAHDPFLIPAWYGETPKPRAAAYAKAVEFTDAFVGEVLRRLDDLGLTGNTIVCVLGDHGESLRAESERSRWIPFEEVIRVPWLIRWPGRVQPQTRITWPCSQMDVSPTLLSLMGFDISAAGFEGLDAFKPIDAQRRLYFSSWFEDSPEGYIEGNRKFVFWPYLDKVFEFDLATDPGERAPILVDGALKSQIISDIADWKRDSYVYFSPRRFRERLLFDHWQAFASGRIAWSYYVSGDPGTDGKRN